MAYCWVWSDDVELGMSAYARHRSRPLLSLECGLGATFAFDWRRRIRPEGDKHIREGEDCDKKRRKWPEGFLRHSKFRTFIDDLINFPLALLLCFSSDDIKYAVCVSVPRIEMTRRIDCSEIKLHRHH